MLKEAEYIEVSLQYRYSCLYFHNELAFVYPFLNLNDFHKVDEPFVG